MTNIPHKIFTLFNYSFNKINGQGLIEALVIAVFISFNVVGFISFQNYLAYNTELTQQKFNAFLLAESQIESLRSFSIINTTSGYNAYQDISSNTISSTVNNTTYTITNTVTVFSTPNYKNINIKITWSDRRGNTQSIILITNIASIDPGVSASFM